MDIKFKKLSDKAILPIRAYEHDAGLDLTATNISTEINECGQLILVYHTDLAVEIPAGYVGLVFPRSSIYKKSLTFTNSVGVIDSGYRGEITAKIKTNTDVIPAVYKQGDKFAQLVIVPLADVNVVEAEELSKSDRGDNGYGSSDNNNVSAATGSDNTDQTVPEPAAGSEEPKTEE